MRYAARAAATLFVATFSIGLTATPSISADILWKVENPFRFFKRSASFDMYERAFDAVRGNPSLPVPDKIIWKTERRLNDPDCKDIVEPQRLRQLGAQELREQPAGLGVAYGRLHLLRPQGATPLHGGVRPALFLGHRARGLRAARGAHGPPVALARDPRRAAGRRLHLDLDAAPHRRRRRDAQAGLQGPARHQAAALFARPPHLGRHRQGAAAGRPRAGRPGGAGRGPVHHRDGRQLHVGRRQSRQADRVQRHPADGLRSDQLRHARRGDPLDPQPVLRGRLGPQIVRSEGAAQAADGRRAQVADLPAQLARVRRGVRQGGRAVAVDRLPSVAIRLSVPRQPRARAGEPASRRDARQRRLLGRRHRRGPVLRDDGARALQRGQGQAAARPDQRPDLPQRRRRAAPARRATRCRPIRRARPRSAARPSPSAGARPPTASGRSISCSCRSAATTSASRRSPCTRSPTAAAISRRSPAGSDRRSATARRCRAPTWACSTSASRR